MSNAAKGTIMAILAGMLYGTLGYFGTKLLHAQFSVPGMLFWRFLFAALVMLPFVFSVPRASWYKSRRVLGMVLVLAIFFYSTSAATYFLASRSLGTGLSMVIFFCYPAFVVLLVWWIDKEKPSLLTIASLVCMMLGCGLIAGKESVAFDKMGMAWAMVSAISFAIYVIGSQKTSAHVDPKLSTFLVCLGNMLVFLAVTWCDSSFQLPTVLHHWGYLLAVAIVATVLPILLFLECLKHISPSKASILGVLEPVMTLALGVMLLSEPVSGPEIAGAILILLGTVIVQRKQRHNVVFGLEPSI